MSYKVGDKIIFWITPEMSVDPKDCIFEEEIVSIEKTITIKDDGVNITQKKILYEVSLGLDEFFVNNDQVCVSYNDALLKVYDYLNNKIDCIDDKLDKFIKLKIFYEDKLLEIK